LILPFDACPAGSATDVIAASDRVDVVIDYGGLPVGEGTDVPAPTLTVLLDGALTQTSAALQPARSPRLYFVGSFAAPAHPGSVITLSAQAAVGYGSGTVSFPLKEPDIQISIDQCVAGADCSMVGGGSTAAVRISVAGSSAQHVNVRSELDGIAQAGATTIDTMTVTADHRVEGIGFIDTPSVPAAARWQLIAELGPSRRSSATIAVTPPEVGITIDECRGGDACQLLAGVGSVHARVSVGGTKPQHVLVQSELDGVLQTGSTTIEARRTKDMTMEGDGFVDVPAQLGSWKLVAQVAPTTTPSSPIELTAPTITATLTCGASCTPPAKSTVGVRISAPLRLRSHVATLTAIADGVTIVPGATQTLTEEDQPTQTVSGTMQVPLPDAAGKALLVRVSVGGFAADTIVTQIGPAAASAP
jgi:hypothetical protein